MTPRPQIWQLCLATLSLILLFAWPAQAADRDRLDAFLDVTGFDVAIESIRLSADSAPEMLGVEADSYGPRWDRIRDEVFDTDLMQGMARDILAETLDDARLAHAAAFYASDLGQRLVAVENAAHMQPDRPEIDAESEAMVAEMRRTGSPRLATLARMNRAIDSSGHGVRAVLEVQYRFLVAASAAGLFDLQMDPADLRLLLLSQEGELRESLQQSALAGAAYTYRDISDADLSAYADALEHPDMQMVYELMNAVQFEVMANRFEALAPRMTGLSPGQDI
ncbi:MAG: DUF2059 domain-containing protein [Marinibacterium sp.]|nr:DUF2059 domain-containing protein [Marinibacterium sp.]